MTRILPILIPLALGTFACNDEEEPLADVVRAFNDELTSQQMIWCDCHEALGYEGRNDCIDSVTTPGPSQERCLEDALARDEEAARDWLACVLPLEEEYTACLNSRLSCDEGSSAVDQCGDDYYVGREECIELPESVSRAIDECFPD